jgi:hypothetical protein
MMKRIFRKSGLIREREMGDGETQECTNRPTVSCTIYTHYTNTDFVSPALLHPHH